MFDREHRARLCGGSLGLLLAILAPVLSCASGLTGWLRADEVHVDWRVCSCHHDSILTATDFRMIPARERTGWQFGGPSDSRSRSITGVTQAVGSAFVVSQIALALVLLVRRSHGRTQVLLPRYNPELTFEHSGRHA